MFGIDDAALALALAAGVQTAGGLYANSQNKKAQKEINEQALNVAALNNATQIDMANTAHQREVSDLRRAGLNPILSAGGSGAAVPQMQSPSLGAWNATNPVSDAGNTAAQMSRYMGQSYRQAIAQQAARTDNVLADTEVKYNTAENLATQNKNLDAQHDLYKAQTLETLANTDLKKAEKDYPGLTGQVFRSMQSLGRDVRGAVDDLTTNATQAVKGWLDPATWSSPSNQARRMQDHTFHSRRYGTGDGSSIEVKMDNDALWYPGKGE